MSDVVNKTCDSCFRESDEEDFTECVDCGVELCDMCVNWTGLCNECEDRQEVESDDEDDLDETDDKEGD